MKPSFSLIVALLILGAAGAAGARPSTCRATAQDLWQSCRLGSRGDYWTQRGICANVSAAAEREDCIGEARQDQQDALRECADRHDARLAACDELGGGPYDPPIDPANFVAAITNPYLPLTPGTTFHYRLHDGEHVEETTLEVTHDVKTILGVACTVVHDVVSRDGEVIEDTFDWFAQDVDGNVWYFGEETQELEGGERTSIEGSWKAGRDGARPGIVMEADPQVGDFYRQELLAQEAEDVARVVDLEGSAAVPFGTFHDALVTEDFTPLEPDAVERKYYAPGIGTILTLEDDGNRDELVSIAHD